MRLYHVFFFNVAFFKIGKVAMPPLEPESRKKNHEHVKQNERQDNDRPND